MIPSPSITRYVGKEWTLKACSSLRSASRYWTQSVFFLDTNSRQAPSSSSALTLININFSVGYYLVSSFNSGTEARQGGHHVAQKSKTTIRPVSCLSETR